MVLTGTDAHPPTSSCRDARSERPSPSKVTTSRLRSLGRSTTDAQTERPYSSRLCASAPVKAKRRQDRLTTDAQTERPYRTQSRLVSSRSFESGRPPTRHTRASLQDSVSVRPLCQRLRCLCIPPPNRCSFPSGVVGWGVAIQRSSPDRSRDQSGLQVC